PCLIRVPPAPTSTSLLSTFLPLTLFLSSPRAPPDLHSFPTRRSSDLSRSPCLATSSRPRTSAPGRTTRPSRQEANPTTSAPPGIDRKSTRLNSSHQIISYAVFCLK